MRNVLFRIALLAYPRAFRRRFGAEMRDEFVRSRHGFLSLATHVANGLQERGTAITRWAYFPTSTPHLYESSGRHAMFWDLWRGDIRHTIRLAIKTPVFTILTILALALGIGATTAIFALVNGVLLRSLPYRDDARLVNVWSFNTKENRPRNHVVAGEFPRLPEDEHDARRARGLLQLRLASADDDRERRGDRVFAIRDAEHVQHARPPGADRTGVQRQRAGTGRRVERRLLAAPIRRRRTDRRQDAHAERIPIPGRRRDAARLRLPLSGDARPQRIHAHHRRRSLAANHLLRPEGGHEPDPDAGRSDRARRPLVGGDRPHEAWGDPTAGRSGHEDDCGAARALVPGDQHGLERHRGADDRSVGRHDPAGAADPASPGSHSCS